MIEPRCLKLPVRSIKAGTTEKVEEQMVEEEKAKDTAEAPTSEKSKSSMDISEIVKKLDGLNSKERRKFLRQLKSKVKKSTKKLLLLPKRRQRKLQRETKRRQ